MRKSIFHTKRTRERMGFQRFVIHRFLVIMLFVVVSEALVVSILDMFLIPIIQNQLFGGGNLSNIETDIWKILVFVLLVAIIILLFLAPLMVSASWFSKIIIGEVHRNERKKEELHREYEKKRNLMLSDIAHDLRTPITTIAGYAKALNDGMVTGEEKTREYLEAIESKSKRMSELINLLFDYVKMDSSGFSLKMEEVNLTELLRENAALLYQDVEEKGMELEVLIPEEVCMVQLDQVQVSRVIANLIGNAIRHNENGTTITIQMTKDKERIRIVVADDGEVIEETVANYIFEPFMVGDASRMTKGGSGLGLSIVKRIVDMHGWKIHLEQNTPEYKKAFVIDVIL